MSLHLTYRPNNSLMYLIPSAVFFSDEARGDESFVMDNGREELLETGVTGNDLLSCKSELFLGSVDLGKLIPTFKALPSLMKSTSSSVKLSEFGAIVLIQRTRSLTPRRV
mmetsp:Transcript_12424/g.15122  ORF Transcript_12424/g.15122 Transcript_12424/m.15122 type:complete len:110 (+) Transcript_12424:130-459(+)